MSETETFESTVRWLFGQLAVFQHSGQSAYKPGLDMAHRLSSLFGNPHRGLRAVHVAGTNGKGSTSSSLASVLQAAGYRTGLYTSPHLVDFRERIRINGRMISREEVVDFVSRYRSMEISRDMSPSFFELTTIMAFEHFRRHGVDIAVIETGLGGRLDTTNIITPCLSVITNISPDHTALLGHTLREIASEKAGIIKRGVPAVIGEADGEVREVFEAKAAAEHAPVMFVRDYAPIAAAFDDRRETIYVTRGHGVVRGSLRGQCQPLNTATVLTAVDILNARCMMHIPDRAIRRGLGAVERSTGLTGRWTTVSEHPRVICDTGHNIGGWDHLVHDLNALHGRKILVLGFVNDKDVTGIIDRVAKVTNSEVIFTNASVARALDPAELRTLAESRGVSGDIVEGVAEAAAEAVGRAEFSGATVFIGGSNFVVGDYLASRSNNEV